MATDGTVKAEDQVAAEKAAAEAAALKAKQETSEKEAPTFTEEQAKAMALKAANDALSAAGRSNKAFEAREQSIKDAEERLSQSKTASRQAEIESARDDPDALAAIRKRHSEAERQDKLDKKERELDDKEAKADEKLERVTKAEAKERAGIVALKHDVDAGLLEKFTDGTLESMEELAKSLPKKGEAPPAIKPDSGKTLGGGTMPNNLEDFKVWIDNLPQTVYEARAPEIKARLKELQNK